jgi:hypothetical protein
MNDMAEVLKYVSPHQVTMATAISKDKLTNLINLGVIKAKRVDARTVLIELDSVLSYINSLPDVEPEIEARHDEVTLDSAMKDYNDQRRKAMVVAPSAISKVVIRSSRCLGMVSDPIRRMMRLRASWPEKQEN